MEETMTRHKGMFIQEKELTPREQRDAGLMLTLMVFAKTLQAIDMNRRNPNRENAAKSTRDWVLSLMEHGHELYGDGTRMEAETLEMCRDLRMVIEQHNVSAVAQA